MQETIEELRVQRDYWKNLHEIAESKIITLQNQSTILALRLTKCNKESQRMLQKLREGL